MLPGRQTDFRSAYVPVRHGMAELVQYLTLHLPGRWGAEVNAKITPAFFTWLVGPMQIEEAEVQGQMQRSSVHIKRCRWVAVRLGHHSTGRSGSKRGSALWVALGLGRVLRWRGRFSAALCMSSRAAWCPEVRSMAVGYSSCCPPCSC